GRDDRVQLLGPSPSYRGTQRRAPEKVVTVLRAPRPEPPAQVVERVLPRHAHRAVSLMGSASCGVSSTVGEQLRCGDLESCRAAPPPAARAAPSAAVRTSAASWAPWTRCCWTAWNRPTGLPNCTRSFV